MKFTPTTIAGLFVVDLEKRADERGFLARTWDKKEFAKYGIPLDVLEGYTCYTKKRGTLRGFHYMRAPKEEIKLTRVVRGKLFEVVLDLRPASPTFKKWQGFTLSAADRKLLVIPAGCAHAILALEDDTEYISLYNEPYDPTNEGGVRYDDPTFGIQWPIPVTVVSEKDRSWPDYKSL